MTDRERQQAEEALIRWFKSQKIEPADAMLIMMPLLRQLIGECLDSYRYLTEKEYPRSPSSGSLRHE
jgi:hypothetical protein